jgi:hypothetical protein
MAGAQASSGTRGNDRLRDIPVLRSLFFVVRLPDGE